VGQGAVVGVMEFPKPTIDVEAELRVLLTEGHWERELSVAEAAAGIDTGSEQRADLQGHLRELLAQAWKEGRWSPPGACMNPYGAPVQFTSPLRLQTATKVDQGHAESVHATSKWLRESGWWKFFPELLQRLPEQQRATAESTWLLILQINPDITAPTCGVNDEDADGHEYGHVYFGWNPPGRSLEISVSPLGDVSWIFADHSSGGMSVTSDERPGNGYLGFVGLFSRKAVPT